MVKNFGSYLRNERELRGIPLEEIADNTKIHMRFLEALENNHYDKLPGEVFVKGYIRSYAKTIGTDVEEILAIYDESAGKEKKDKIWSEEEQGKRQFRQKQKFRNFLVWCGVIIAGIFFLILVFRLFIFSSNPDAQNKGFKTDYSTSKKSFSLGDNDEMTPLHTQNNSSPEPTLEGEIIPPLAPLENKKRKDKPER